MMDRRKWNNFISTLSSEEINAQLADIFAFATEFKSMLEAELVRRYSPSGNQEQDYSYPVEPEKTKYDESKLSSEEYSAREGVQIDFVAMNKIQRAVADLTVEQLLEEMANLDDYLSTILPFQAPDYQEKLFARETCELRYFDLFHEESIECPHCRTYLTPEQCFCGKCGNKVVRK